MAGLPPEANAAKGSTVALGALSKIGALLPKGKK
jgi:hypothetical protein